MSRLILIRHSISRQDPTTPSHNWSLSEEGRSRCQILSEHLRAYRVDRIFTSDESKALQTAEHLADGLLIDFEIAPDLHETCRATVPYFDNLDDFHTAVHEAMLHPYRIVFGEETFDYAFQRFDRTLRLLMEQHYGENLAIVTHGTVMSLFIARYSGMDDYRLWRSLGMPAYAVFEAPDMTLRDLVRHVD